MGRFVVLALMLNRWLPLAFQCDLPSWTYPTEKAVYWSLFRYAGLFLVVPLVLTKGWGIVRQPAFLLPLLASVSAITLRHSFLRLLHSPS